MDETKMATVMIGLDDDGNPPQPLGVFDATVSVETMTTVARQLERWGVSEVRFYEIPANPTAMNALGQWTDDVEGWLREFVDQEEEEEEEENGNNL